ncbi:hypothetical protein QL285_057145 [Trifolium repens]|nr:hypothetical protein QL285_057145 [Trifolium repens]
MDRFSSYLLLLISWRTSSSHRGTMGAIVLRWNADTSLFLHCDYAAKVWYEMMRWLGLVIVIPSNLVTSFAILVGCAKDKKAKKGLILIWNAIVWVLWKHRNDRIFNDREMNIEELVDQIKLWSWRWFINRMATGPCLLYEWNWSPFDCFNR